MYKILRANFVKYFGGLTGEPVERMRASIILKQNWLRSKLDFLQSLPPAQLESSSLLEYRNEQEWAKLKPTKEFIKEVPFMKNNPRQSQVTEENGL